MRTANIRRTEKYKLAYRLMTNNISTVPFLLQEKEPNLSAIEWIECFLPLFTESVESEEYEIALGFKDAINDFIKKVYGVDVPKEWTLKMPPYKKP